MNHTYTMTADMFAEAEKYWLKKFSGELNELNLLTDFPRTKRTKNDNFRITFGKGLTEKLMDISKTNDLSLFVILLTCFKILVYKLTGQNDIMIASPTLSKSKQNYNKCVVFRDILPPNSNFKQILMMVKKTVVEGYKKQYFPIKKLIEILKIENNFSLFKVIFTLESIHDRGFIKDIPAGFEHDIVFSIAKNSKELAGEITYNSEVFKRETIQKLIDRYLHVLKVLLNDVNLRIAHLEITIGREKKQILHEFNNTKLAYPGEKTIHGLFKEQVHMNPDVIALVYDDVDTNSREFLSYRQLNDKTGRLAAVLRAKGVKANTIVGLMVNRSIEMTVGLLGILKAGGAYLPIDLKYPEERIRFVLTDCGVNFLLSRGELLNLFRPGLFFCELIDIFDKRLYLENNTISENVNTPGDLSYVNYTSGSTGKPKSVMVEHKNVIRLVKKSNYLVFKKGDRLLLTGVLVFDITTFEIWGVLLNSLTLYLTDESVVLSIEKLAGVLFKNRISILHLIPQLFNQLADQDIEIFSGLKYFLVGGDVVRPQNINKLRKEVRDLEIIHMYGPTENTTFSAFHKIDRDYESKIPIGKPISNSTAYILDNWMNLQPVHAVGELYTGGEGIARGYLNAPELTWENFMIDPFSSPGKRLYKTGDMARWLPGGSIEFIGRIDNQVKIRGGRIELGEIENVILRYKKVKECIVVTKEFSGNKHLCAYIVPAELNTAYETKSTDALETNLRISELKYFLSREIPNHMIPTYFVKLEKLPLNTNGKVDRRSLPEPAGDVKSETEYAAPQTDMEKLVADTWKEILKLDRVGINDNFFDLGGNSMLILQLCSKLKELFRQEVSVVLIFRYPTISSFLQYMISEKNLEYVSVKKIDQSREKLEKTMQNLMRHRNE